MSQGRERDWSVTAGWSVRHLAELPARLARLGLLGSVLGGLAVDQLAHSPQDEPNGPARAVATSPVLS
jgi:hypothetical protein